MSRSAASLKTRPSETADDDPRWQAVIARAPTEDGRFVFGVSTTGVYCRPSCGARRPNRENVAFFDTPDAAEAAGFRPCKRCRPRAAAKAETDAALIAAACRAIEIAEAPPALEDLAAAARLSPHHFHRLFKAVTGVTPKAYAVANRRARVQDGLRSARTVTEAVFDAGYNTTGRFYDGANGMLGMSPKAFRAGAPGVALKFAIAPCALGLVLVAATEKGIATILLGDDEEALRRDLSARYPKAELIQAGKVFDAMLADVVRFVDTPSQGLNLPLDIRGTAFQQRVWAALRALPPGETASYADIARAIDQPDAVRAVASACAANPLAVAIPCHRVVRSDGALSGYRWGVARKRALLAREEDQRKRALLAREEDQRKRALLTREKKG